MSDKYLVNCAYGTEEAEKATIAFILAYTSAKTSETRVFATAGATELLLRESRPEVRGGWLRTPGRADRRIHRKRRQDLALPRVRQRQGSGAG